MIATACSLFIDALLIVMQFSAYGCALPAFSLLLFSLLPGRNVLINKHCLLASSYLLVMMRICALEIHYKPPVAPRRILRTNR